MTTIEEIYYKSYENIYQNVTDKTLLNSMIGINTGEQQTLAAFQLNNFNNLTRQSNYYNFWSQNTGDNVTTNIENSITLLQGFISGSTTDNELTAEEQTTQRKNFLIANAYITFIMQFFFFLPIYNNGVTRGNFLPALVSNEESVNYSDLLLKLQIFMRTDKLKGAGNYQIGEYENDVLVVPSFDDYIQYNDQDALRKQNRGFIFSLCSQNLRDYIQNNNEELTDTVIYNYRNDVATSPVLNAWCGCFTPSSSILQEADINKNNAGDTECDPICYKPKTIQRFEPLINGLNYGQVISCKRSICVIDNISIIAYGNQGSINFNQICEGCANGGCLCYLDVTNDSLVDKIVSGRNGMDSQVNFLQYCPGSVCYVVEPETNNAIPVDCSKVNTPNTGELFPDNDEGRADLAYLVRIKSSFWYILIFSIFFFILYIAALIEIKMKNDIKFF